MHTGDDALQPTITDEPIQSTVSSQNWDATATALDPTLTFDLLDTGTVANGFKEMASRADNLEISFDNKFAAMEQRMLAAMQAHMSAINATIKENNDSLSDELMKFIGVSAHGVLDGIKDVMKTNLLPRHPMSLLRRVPTSTTEADGDHDDANTTAAENVINAAEAVGLNPLLKISSSEMLEKFNAHIIEEGVAMVYVCAILIITYIIHI